VAIGLFFLAVARIRVEAGLWPLVGARGVSVTLFAALAVAMGRSLRMPATVAAIAVGGGILDMLANVLYLVASRYGPLSVVVTLTSLYPAGTVLLARTVLGERLSALQIVGVICALAAIVLIVGTR
jgi:drug/metabolite transporter (DMT)-like permease